MVLLVSFSVFHLSSILVVSVRGQGWSCLGISNLITQPHQHTFHSSRDPDLLLMVPDLQIMPSNQRSGHGYVTTT
ncbi:hypothetical protein NHX12_012160 [Muraenolepis orangiensis]|uniref:Secreted protein n=1 Tax=Muraenolepis orangiensis TaxID=630683 RepID=A0A9Q0I8D1_9TELE|nr:hypothetical protein NHX12_012160 [Muraenolepis orangiensis]